MDRAVQWVQRFFHTCLSANVLKFQVDFYFQPNFFQLHNVICSTDIFDMEDVWLPMNSDDINKDTKFLNWLSSPSSKLFYSIKKKIVFAFLIGRRRVLECRNGGVFHFNFFSIWLSAFRSFPMRPPVRPSFFRYFFIIEIRSFPFHWNEMDITPPFHLRPPTAADLLAASSSIAFGKWWNNLGADTKRSKKDTGPFLFHRTTSTSLLR